MNQEHARFVADLLEERCGVKAELVVSDLDDASRRIARFATSRDPWIVAVHMISEGVDIPRLRVGVFASNVVSELYFRQFCGRFVRTGSDAESAREAYVYLPDDARLRSMAASITADVRRALHVKRERDEIASALSAADRTESVSDAGEFASIVATAREGHTLDFGPLFNPTKYLNAPPDAPPGARANAKSPAIAPDPEPPIETHAERRERIRRDLKTLVARASTAFSVDHKLVHATLNQRFGGPVATATIAGLESRRQLVTLWLERRTYDGLR
jgi:superfamily II DNA or RNA helicase